MVTTRTAAVFLSACAAGPRCWAPARARTPLCSATTFADLGLREETIEALRELGVLAPNLLQTQAMPCLCGRGDLIVGAQTGSGKTLTYLVPIMQTLKADEEAAGSRARPKRPRAIVIVPTRELALQVHGVGHAIGKHLRLSVKAVHGGTPVAPQGRMLDFPVDLLVATPGRLLQLLDKGLIFLGDVRHVIVDEACAAVPGTTRARNVEPGRRPARATAPPTRARAPRCERCERCDLCEIGLPPRAQVDTMFEAGFGEELDRLLAITTRDLSTDDRATESARAATAAARVQHVAVGATHPASAAALYERRLGGAKRMNLPGMHSTPPQLRQHFITCKGPDGKVAALRELLGPATEGRPLLGRVVLFCNSQDSARFVDHYLSEEGYKTANYHGAVPANARAENFASFLRGDAAVLVTTDIAARGLDNLEVEHVVQFDFPRSASEYIHRCGRTARAGKPGSVHNLVTKHDTELVRAIRAAHEKGEDLLLATASAVTATAASEGTLRIRSGRGAAFPTGKGLTRGGSDGEMPEPRRGAPRAAPREPSVERGRGAERTGPGRGGRGSARRASP